MVHQFLIASATPEIVLLRLFGKHFFHFSLRTVDADPRLLDIRCVKFLRSACLAIAILLAAPATDAAQIMRVPFNFQWGEPSARVEQSLKGIKARIIERRTVNGRTLLTAEGIPQKFLRRTVFYFRDDALCEIELQYGDPSWDTVKYQSFFEEVRRNVDGKYGVGRQLVLDRTREGDVVQSLSGYQWLQGAMSLRLFLFAAEKNAQALRVLSLHYREI
jgi:hypothetical protein